MIYLDIWQKVAGAIGEEQACRIAQIDEHRTIDAVLKFNSESLDAVFTQRSGQLYTDVYYKFLIDQISMEFVNFKLQVNLDNLK